MLPILTVKDLQEMLNLRIILADELYESFIVWRYSVFTKTE